MNRQAWRDFFITAFLLSISFVIALLSSIAAEQNQVLQGAIAAAISLLLALVGALYIIPKLARNIRLEILRFAVRTTVTIEGVLFMVFLAVIGVAAWNTSNNLLYLILSALLAFLVAANLIGRMSLADLSIQLRFPDHIFAGEPATIIVTLTNHKHIVPAYSLLIEAVSEESSGKRYKKNKPKDDDSEEADEQPEDGHEIGKLAYFVLTPPRASARSRVDYTFERRGCYPIKGFRISTKFPAGFLKKWRRIDATGEILVYPKPKPLDDFYHALPILAGQIQSAVRGSGDDLYAIRRYHPSDHMRNIDWKATAKSRELMVREHTREDDRRLTIVLDTARPARPFLKPSQSDENIEDKNKTVDEEAASQEFELDGFEERFEQAVVMAASLANHFILEHAEVELITPDPRLNAASGSGPDHLYKILRSLARVKLSPLEINDAPNKKSRPEKKSFFARLRQSNADKSSDEQEQPNSHKPDTGPAWRLLDEMPSLADERRFKVLITSAAKGTIPASVWRSAHVVFMEDL
jgi:uncharacterized protein (DUF58 family)